MWDTDWTSPDTNDVVAANRLWTEDSVVHAPVSQVLVGVALALAVRREAQERQLLVAALQLQDFVAQVQATLRTRGRKKRYKSSILGTRSSRVLRYNVSFLAFKQQF